MLRGILLYKDYRRLLLNALLAVLDNKAFIIIRNLLSSEVVERSISILYGINCINACFSTCSKLEAVATQLGLWAYEHISLTCLGSK